MSAEVFLDTNVLVYAYDSRDPAKQATAQGILTQALRNENTALSAQVLGEFFTVVTRKIPDPLTTDEALEVIDTLSALRTVEIDRTLVSRAIEVHKRYQLAYGDGLIVGAAERAGCPTVLSEDLADGAEYFGVRASNPFG